MNAWSMMINGFAAPWLEALLRACWQGGLAIGLVWLVCRVWPQISPRAKSWLWRLAFLKLVVAFLWPVSINVPLFPSPALPTAQRPRVESPRTQLVPPAGVPSPALASPTASLRPAPARLSLAGWLLLAWSAGVGVHLACVLWESRQTGRLRRSCRPPEDEHLDHWCAEGAQRLRLRRTPSVRVTDKVSQPLLLGLCRPSVILPNSLLASATSAQLRMMLAHELAHAKRLDLWWGWLRWLGEAWFYFHPLIWLSRGEWRLTQEMACDALAVSAAESPLADYGAMLLEISTVSNGLLTVPSSGTVGIIETKTNLERRLKAMKFIRQEISKQTWVATACLLCAGTVGTLPWRAVAQSPAAQVHDQADKEEAVTSARAQPKSPPQELDRETTLRNADLGVARANSRRAQALLKASAAPQDQANKSEASRVLSERVRRIGRIDDPADKAENALRVFSLRYANAVDMVKQLEALNQAEIADKTTNSSKLTVVADPRTNALIVQAQPDDLARIARLVQVLDVRTAEKADAVESGTDAGESSRPIGILPPRPGFVQKVFVKFGKTVKKGDPLVQLDEQEAQGKLYNALAQVEVAKAALGIQEAEAKGVRREYERLKLMADDKVVSSHEVDAKMTTLEVAQARVAKAQAELRLAEQQAQQAKLEVGLLTIRAPKDGTVNRVRVQVGEYVAATASQPLMLIRSE